MAMIASVQALIGAYGAMFYASGPAALLMFAATLAVPQVGVSGIVGGLGGLAARRLFRLPGLSGDLDLLNAVLAGLALGTSREVNERMLALALLGGALAVLAAHSFRVAERTPGALKLLSLPSIATVWLIYPVAAASGLPLAAPGATPWSTGVPWLDVFLLSTGAMFYSPSIVAGAMVAIGLLMTSRVLFVIGILAFFTAEATLALLTATPFSPLRIAVGANAMLAGMVMGGLYISPRLDRLFVPITAAMLSTFGCLAFSTLLSTFAMPALSLPFIFAGTLCLRLFHPAHASAYAGLWLPEARLPEKSRSAARFLAARGFKPGSVALALPFQGALEIYQGFDGAHTHQGDWRHGVDFIETRDGAAFCAPGTVASDFHCFGAPVMAPAAGVIVAVLNELPDNAPGAVDLVNNWGNYVMLQTGCGHYVLLAHLQQHSVTVYAGQPVSAGVVVGRIGNSGRSPQPHLHVHVQKEPWLGAPTVPFHFAHACTGESGGARYWLDYTPRERDCIAAPDINLGLAGAIRLPVGQYQEFAIIGGRSPSLRIASEIGLTGEWSFVSNTGARCRLTHTGGLFALHDRTGPSDEYLDALILAIGLTPLADNPVCTWRDAPKAALLPIRGWRGWLHWIAGHLLGNLDSQYTRHWDEEGRVWLQSGRHNLRLAALSIEIARTRAWLSEADGLTRFELAFPGAMVLIGELRSLGQKADHGIPAWRIDIAA